MNEYFAFVEGVVGGLVDRLSRKAPGQEELVRYAIQFALDHFGPLARAHGLEAARQTTHTFVAFLSARTVSRSKQPSPLALLFEKAKLVEEINGLRARGSYQGRKDWLRRHEKMAEKNAADVAIYSGAEPVARETAQ